MRLLWFLGLFSLWHTPLFAQQAALSLSVEEAVEVALTQNYALRSGRVTVDNASAQVREAWAGVMPTISLNSSYTRNIKAANPFSGSEAGSLFGSLGFVDWLAYNERARTDDSPTTSPIAFQAFLDSVSAGFSRAGIVQSTNSNPFAVPNQFQNALTISQPLYNGAAFAAVKGAERLRNLSRRGLDRQEQIVANQVRQQYFQAQLAAAQVDVVQQSLARTQQSEAEMARRVQAGVAPLTARLGFEVQRANLEAQLLLARNSAALALEQLRFTLGIPEQITLTLLSPLEAPITDPLDDLPLEDAMAEAYLRRPDLEQARIAVELRGIDREITRSAYFPVVSATGTLAYVGNVPDNRTSITRDGSDPARPFVYTQTQRSFFSDSYWQPSVSAGISLSWTLFNGFRTAAQVQQRTLAVTQASIEEEQIRAQVHLDVSTALRTVAAARARVVVQERAAEVAQTNYQFAEQRLAEGVASPIEVREASEQLDQARLNLSQARLDLLLARSALRTALGLPVSSPN